MAEETTTHESEGAAPAAPSATPSRGAGLELRHLSKVFPGGTVAVDDVNLTIEHGEYVVLLGPSGCGKTTTLRMIGGHEFPSSGEILLDGESLVELTPDKRPTTTVFQHFALFPHRNVLENVEFGLKMHGMPKAERRRRSMETLEMVGLEQLADRKPRALSGGQQQRVAIARAVIARPSLLIADEPTGNVDDRIGMRLMYLFEELNKLGSTVLVATHNEALVGRFGHRQLRVDSGRLLTKPRPAEVG